MLVNLVKLGRPHFLILGLAVFGFGAAWAAAYGAQVSLPQLSWGALVVLLAQLSVNYSNDYFDLEVDQSGSITLLSGGSGVLLQHPELKQPARWLALGLITASLLAGAAFLWYYHMPLWLMSLVVLGNLGGWYYSAPPLRLSARGWGEPCIALILSILVPGMGYITAQGLPDGGGAFILLPLILYSLACSLDVELPDREVDLAGGKKNWVVRWGRRFGLGVIGLLFLSCTIYFFSIPVLVKGEHLINFHILGLLSFIPFGAGIAGWFRRPLNREHVTSSAALILACVLLFVLLVDAYLIWVSMQY
jgi:1,4-dihydroxy-2-naphthoate octaprenyltransferase